VVAARNTHAQVQLDTLPELLVAHFTEFVGKVENQFRMVLALLAVLFLLR
jgi:hypothetical protein